MTALRTASSYQRFPKPGTALSVGITSSSTLPASQHIRSHPGCDHGAIQLRESALQTLVFAGESTSTMMSTSPMVRTVGVAAP